MANTNFNSFGRGTVISDQATYDAGLRAHMIRVYNYMASGLALSGIVAFALFSSPELASLFFQVQRGHVVGFLAFDRFDFLFQCAHLFLQFADQVGGVIRADGLAGGDDDERGGDGDAHAGAAEHDALARVEPAVERTEDEEADDVAGGDQRQHVAARDRIEAVDIGIVDEVHPEIDGARHEALVFGIRRSGESPTTKPDRANFAFIAQASKFRRHEVFVHCVRLVSAKHEQSAVHLGSLAWQNCGLVSSVPE